MIESINNSSEVSFETELLEADNVVEQAHIRALEILEKAQNEADEILRATDEKALDILEKLQRDSEPLNEPTTTLNDSKRIDIFNKSKIAVDNNKFSKQSEAASKQIQGAMASARQTLDRATQLLDHTMDRQKVIISAAARDADELRSRAKEGHDLIISGAQKQADQIRTIASEESSKVLNVLVKESSKLHKSHLDELTEKIKDQTDHIILTARKQSDVITKHAEDEAHFIREKTQQNIAKLWTITHNDINHLTEEIREGAIAGQKLIISEAEHIKQMAVEQAKEIINQATGRALRLPSLTERMFVHVSGMKEPIKEKLLNVEAEVSRIIEDARKFAESDRESVLELARHEALEQMESTQAWVEQVHREAIDYGQNLVRQAQRNADQLRAQGLLEADRRISDAKKEADRRFEEVKTFTQSLRNYAGEQVQTQLQMAESEARQVVSGAYDQLKYVLDDAQNTSTMIHERACDNLAQAMAESMVIIDKARQNGLQIENKATEILEAAREQVERIINEGRIQAEKLVHEAEDASETMRQQAVDYHDLLVRAAEVESETIISEAHQLESTIIEQAQASGDQFIEEAKKTKELGEQDANDILLYANTLLTKAQNEATELMDVAKASSEAIQSEADWLILESSKIADQTIVEADQYRMLIETEAHIDVSLRDEGLAILERAKQEAEEIILKAKQDSDYMRTIAESDALEVKQEATRLQNAMVMQKTSIAEEIQKKAILEAKAFMDDVRDRTKKEWAQAEKLNKLIDRQHEKLKQIEQRVREGIEQEARIKARVEIIVEPLLQRKEHSQQQFKEVDVLNMPENGLFIANPKVNKNVSKVNPQLVSIKRV